MSLFDRKKIPAILLFIALSVLGYVSLHPPITFFKTLWDVHVDSQGARNRNKIERVIDQAMNGTSFETLKGASQYFITTTGSGTTCSIGSPCGIALGICGSDCSAFNPKADDIVWLEAGTYSPFNASGKSIKYNNLGGTLGHPVTFRNYQNGHVILDMGTFSNAADGSLGNCLGNAVDGNVEGDTKGMYVTFWGLDCQNSKTFSRYCPTDGCNAIPGGGTDVLWMHDGALASGRGVSYINNFVRDAVDCFESSSGAQNSSGVYINGGGHLFRGNLGQYCGELNMVGGVQRGHYGHVGYFSNPDRDGDTIDRTTITGNIFLRSFDYGTQFYSTSGQESYYTVTNNIFAASGIPLASPPVWPAVSSFDDLYLGASGNVALQCYTTGTKVLYKSTFDSNIEFGGTVGNTLGGSKGMCSDTITNNQFVNTGGFGGPPNSYFPTPVPPAPTPTTCEPGQSSTVSPCGWWAPQTFTGNTLYAPLSGNGAPAAPLTAANYPGNTINSGFPTSGKTFTYWKSPDEIGRGWVNVLNWDGSSTITINLDSMGGYAGEQYRVQNWQDTDPWNAAKDLVTGTCAATCGTVTVNYAAPSIRQPGLDRTDGVTPFDAPGDISTYNGGKSTVTYILYPNWQAAAGTPTPTNTFTPTNTSTPTNTPTITNTPTFTATNTAAATNTPTLTPTLTVTNTPTLTPTVTPTFTSTPALTPTPAINSLMFGVKGCTAFAPMGVTPDATTIGGAHASSLVADNGDLRCPFNVPADGTYRVWVHVSAQATNADSFFIDVDGDNGFNSLTPTPTVGATTPTATPTSIPSSAHVFDSVEQRQPCTATHGGNTCTYLTFGWPTAGFIWNPMNDRLATCGDCSGNFSERDLTLTVAGNPHVLTFRSREAGSPTNETAKLDYFVLTTDLNSDPPTVSPTPTPGPCKQQILCKNRMVWYAIPCNQPPPVNPPCQP